MLWELRGERVKMALSQSLSLRSHLSVLRLISWNLTTQCLAVTGGGSVGESDRLKHPSWLYKVILTYIHTYKTYY